jgi:hypothetical protein
MSIPAMLLFLTVACVVWAVVSALLITAALDRRGITTPVPFIGALIFRNVIPYRDITRKESGKVRRLFYSYVVPISLASPMALGAWLAQGLR